MARETESTPDGATQYSNTDTVRWIVDVSKSGDHVILDDGSKWHVVPSHRQISGNWPRTLKVRVGRVQGRLHALSAESDRDVQAVYQGLQPLHGEIGDPVDAAAELEEDLPAAAGASGAERRPSPSSTELEP
jgi:hypothetical protein